MCCCSYSQWVFLLHFFPSTKEQWYQGGVCTTQRTLKGNSHLSQSVHHAAIWQAIQKYKTLSSFLLSSFSLLPQAVSLLNDPQHFTTKNNYFFPIFKWYKVLLYNHLFNNNNNKDYSWLFNTISISIQYKNEDMCKYSII